MEVITSKTNVKVKFLKGLNEKKERIKNNCFYIEGIKVVGEVLKMKKVININFIAFSSEILKKVSGGNDILRELLSNNDINKVEFTPEIFEYITDTKTPQGILAVVQILENDYIDMLKSRENILLLDKVQDPGNIGTIIRTCDAFSVRNIIYLNGTGDIYSPKTVRSTMGSVLRIKFSKINEDELEKFSMDLKNNNYELIGTSLNTNNYVEKTKFSNKNNVIVFSNEANGISDNVEKICTKLVKISMSDSAESLNVGIASGIILHKLYTDNNT